MKKPSRKKTQGKALFVRRVEDSEFYSVAKNPGNLVLLSHGRGRGKTVGIYGDPKGLRFLAELLTNVADIDQARIPDHNCPKGVGAHYHVYKRDGHLHETSSDLIVGRLDGKQTGSFDWLLEALEKPKPTA